MHAVCRFFAMSRALQLPGMPPHACARGSAVWFITAAAQDTWAHSAYITRYNSIMPSDVAHIAGEATPNALKSCVPAFLF